MLRRRHIGRVLNKWIMFFIWLNTYWEIIHLGTTCTSLHSRHPSTSGRPYRRVCKYVLWRCHRNQGDTWSRNPRTCRSKGNRSFYRKMPFRYRSCISMRTARIYLPSPRRSQPHKKTRILETYLGLNTWRRHLQRVYSYGNQFHLDEKKMYQQLKQQQLTTIIAFQGKTHHLSSRNVPTRHWILWHSLNN